jgi:hypothetical protein
MSVTGIFKTPRGYAAMVEAAPIKLSYTIYPGEKFFDGQLVAVEENRLVFRTSDEVEQQQICDIGRAPGTAEVYRPAASSRAQPLSRPDVAKKEEPRAAETGDGSEKKAPAPIVSPLGRNEQTDLGRET